MIKISNEIKYSFVAQAYNEYLVIFECYKKLKDIMGLTNEAYEFIFENDVSWDKTTLILNYLWI